MRRVFSVALAAALATVLALSLSARGDRAALGLRLVASGFDSPTYVTAPRSQRGLLYVVEQPGLIVVFDNGKLRAQPFLDIRSLVKSGGEQGLLSVAFHPAYAKNHRFYVDYTDVNGDTRVVEYRSNGKTAIPATARQLLFVKQPYPNHNGGQLAFGPDGRLYVGMGDGGSGGDPGNRGQNLGTRLAKLLRIDVGTGRVQIAGYGLRNPWRFSFDRANGDLYIADVGQGSWEEIDYLRHGSTGLVNYGWSVYEGKAKFKDESLNTQGRLVWPIAVYSHDMGCSVTGGYVYRGSAFKALRGRYVYGDFCSGRIWSLLVAGGKAAGLRQESATLANVSSFGEDASGELYAVTLDGKLYRVTG